jgi:hypothetical protein
MGQWGFVLEALPSLVMAIAGGYVSLYPPQGRLRKMFFALFCVAGFIATGGSLYNGYQESIAQDTLVRKVDDVAKGVREHSDRPVQVTLNTPPAPTVVPTERPKDAVLFITKTSVEHNDTKREILVGIYVRNYTDRIMRASATVIARTDRSEGGIAIGERRARLELPPQDEGRPLELHLVFPEQAGWYDQIMARASVIHIEVVLTYDSGSGTTMRQLLRGSLRPGFQSLDVVEQTTSQIKP